jgi:hypothetical protein
MKHDEYDIQTACDIATGDDGTTGKEVLRILKQVANEDWEMMIKGIDKRKKKEVADFFGGEVNGKV